jgi:hypothetical protein
LKVKNIILLKTIPDLKKPIENMYYESNDKPFISTESGNGGAFFVYLRKKPVENIVHVSKDLIEKALDELGIQEGEATEIELITALRKIVERDGNNLVDDGTAWKEILNLLKKVKA